MDDRDAFDTWYAENILWVDGSVIPLSVLYREFITSRPESDRRLWPFGRVRFRLGELVGRLEPGAPLMLANCAWNRPRLILGPDGLLTPEAE